MRYLIVVLLLLCPVTSWAIDPIYQLYDDNGGVAFMVRPTKKKGVYFWYLGPMRCSAKLSGQKVSIMCPGNPTMVAESDSGDVSVKVSGEVVATYTDGSIMYGMYNSIIRHALGKKTYGKVSQNDETLAFMPYSSISETR